MREKRSTSQKPQAAEQKSEEKMTFLARSDLFRYLKPEHSFFEELERSTTTVICPPGRILYRPGEPATLLFFLKTGCIQLYHLSTDGRKLITATLDSGACFGALPLPEPHTYMSFAEAVEETLLYAMNKHDVEQFLLPKPEICFALLQILGQRLTQVEAQLLDTTFKSTTARLAALLLQLASPLGPARVPVVKGLSHEELADRLGVYRETVSSALRELKAARAIEPRRKYIAINDPQLLQILATGDKGGHQPLDA